jgi:hypothetical protein
MTLTEADKRHYLDKAIEIAMAVCATPNSGDQLAMVIQQTYAEMIDIAQAVRFRQRAGIGKSGIEKRM